MSAPHRHSTGKRHLLLRSLVIAGGLTGLKLGVFTMTNSLAILASGAESFSDFLLSLANYLLLGSAARPADARHPYGHGKIESLGGLLQSLVIGASGVGLAGLSIRRFLHPQSLHDASSGIAITVLALVVSLWHIRNLRASAQETSSTLMASEYIHYASDILAYVGVLGALLLFQWTGAAFWDPVISLLIAGYLLKSAAGIFNSSMHELIDENLPGESLRLLDETIRGHDERIVDYHHLRTRQVGESKFIEFHAVLKGVQAFEESHAIADGLVHRIQDVLPHAVVTVHTETEATAETHRS